MLLFWLLSILLFIFSIGFIIYPLFIRSKKQSEEKATTEATIDQKQINIDIAREQLSRLDDDLRANEISQEEYDSLKYELESSLIDDISENSTKTIAKPSNHMALMIMVSLFIPFCSILFYQKLGSPELITAMSAPAKTNSQHSEDMKNASVDELLTMLKTKLEQNPKDRKGWFLLARSYMAVQRYKDSYQAYEKLLELTGEDAAILVSMADALAMSKKGKMAGEPEKLIRRALKVEPDNITGLWLIGIAEKEKGNNSVALDYWKRLYPMVNDPQSKQTISRMIKSVGGDPSNLEDNSAQSDMDKLASEINDLKKAAASNKQIILDISIPEELKSQLEGNELVFIYAKAVTGPVMPLSAVRKRVFDLPATITLDDTTAMTPELKISAFKQVKVGARVSKSGNPVKQKGDLMSEEIIVDVNNKQPVKLVISTTVQ